MPQRLDESQVELAVLSWFQGLGYKPLFGPEIAPEQAGSERATYADVVLAERLRDAIDRLNPGLPTEARDEAARKVLRPASSSLTANNRAFHRMLRDGVEVEYRRADQTVAGDRVQLLSDDVDQNDWLVVNQFTVVENGHNRRADVVVFINGLPIAVFELKSAAHEEATIWNAYSQFQTYKEQIPSLFAYNELLVISDGLNARIGTLTANQEWFKPWPTIDGNPIDKPHLELETLVRGVFERSRLTTLLRNYLAFEQDGERVVKIMAGYHQFHAIETALEATVHATASGGDRRCGVVWHTQGSGKSFSMTFYAGRVVGHEAMQNPTLVVLTDRNDLDDQLFGQFARCSELLRQEPVQAEDREHLRKLLDVASGGVIFTTIQKFMPETPGDKYPRLTERTNVVVVADEAHRSQYDFIDGYARNLRDALPNASFIGFTGTPIELGDKNTRGVFGDYISIYDIERAVHDGATVPIYYESRIAKLELKPEETARLDPDFDEITEGEEEDSKERLKSKWAALESIVGADKRIKLIAKDLVTHYENRCEGMTGKAMVVCMSRRICVDLYDAIVELRPDWHGADDATGAIKIVMTGTVEDPVAWSQHIRNKSARKELAKRFKVPDDPFKIVIVRDMWLTGFDAPCLHTMYVDKPMRGHGLMQAIARVNRVFRDKPGGLVVDYLGLADELRKALATYTQSGGKGQTTIDLAEAVDAMLAKYEICCDMMHGFDWSAWTSVNTAVRLQLLPPAQEHILTQNDGKARFTKAVYDLSRAFALCPTHDEALRIRDDVAFFQQVRVALMKSVGERKSPDQLNYAVRQLVSQAVVAGDEVIDVFTAAGLKRPDISILSDDFLTEVRHLPQRNLAVELLKKLLGGDLKVRRKKNVVQARRFSEMLEQVLQSYKNRAITTHEVIEELIRLAQEMRNAGDRGDHLGLNDEEAAFYDALAANQSAVQVLGDKQLAIIARELVDKVKQNATIDWTIKETVRAKLRVMVRRILKRYGYPPDLQEEATRTVLEQAELLSADNADR